MTDPELTPAFKARLEELSARQDRFDRIVKDLRLEWDEMYDKLRLLYARASKRIKDAARIEENGSESAQDGPGATKDRIPGYGHPPLHERAQGPRRNY